MTLQPDLFDRVNARHTDPRTSAAADRAFTEGGGKASQAWDVLCLVGRHPGCTAMELADFSDLDRYQIQRRISDLTRCGLVGAAVRPRACAKSKRLASTWSLTLNSRNRTIGRLSRMWRRRRSSAMRRWSTKTCSPRRLDSENRSP